MAKQIKLIDKYKFAKIALNKTFDRFVMHIAAIKAPQ